MNLLLFSDLHVDTAAATRIVELSQQVDVVVGAGDFANARRGLSVCINILKHIEKTSVLVPGNNESFDELVTACAAWKSAVILHGTGTEIDGVQFFGIGGGIPVTPFGEWSFDLSENRAAEMLRGCPDGAILISHSPPKGAVDLSSSGQSLGSVSVRETVMRAKPQLVVCGHIHASAGQRKMIGNTTIVNAGPKGVILDL
jgi:Icc-related predicted phosphoesterase